MGAQIKQLASVMADKERWLLWVMGLGLFIQIAGYVFFESGSARNAQVYLWLLLPAVIYGGRLLFTGRAAWPSWQYFSWLLLLLWMALSTLWGSAEEPWDWAKRSIPIALFLLAIHYLLRRDAAFMRKALLLGVAVVALGALASLLYQFVWLEKPLAYRAFRIDRLGIGNFANYDHPVVAGIFHGAIAAWALGAFLDRRTPARMAIFWLAVFSALALYVLLTYTRGAWFGLLGCAIAAVFMQRSVRGWVLLGVGGCCFLLVLLMWWGSLTSQFQHNPLSGREQIWEYFFDGVMSGHWLFGHGLGTPFVFEFSGGFKVYHAHSLFLQLIYDSGLVALALMVAGLLGVFWKVWTLRDDPWVRLAFPAFVFALIAMLTDVERIFVRPGGYWTVFWLPLAILLAVPAPKSRAADA